MAGIRLPPEDTDASQTRQPLTADLISDDDRSIAADSWSIKSDYGSTLDEDQRHADASEALAARHRAASDYSSDKEEPDAEAIPSMLGFQSYWDTTYADELTNFREHGHAGEVWFGADVMEMVASWTKGLCVDIAQKQVQNHHDIDSSEIGSEGDRDLAAWTVLDVGTGNGLLLQELAKQGFSDLTGTDYSEGAIDLARSLADRDGFSSIKFLVDDILETKLDKKFHLVTDKGTLDAIGLHPDGPVKRIMYWESISRLVAPGGLVVITSCNNTKDELVLEVENFNQSKAPGESDANTSPAVFSYLDHIRLTYNHHSSTITTSPALTSAAGHRIRRSTDNMGGGEETQTGEEHKPFDLNDYTIIKEGEAEILMHTKNEVFYNKTQVNNRDMSIAVLRTFISKRKEEHEALLSKRTKKVLKVSEDHESKPEPPSDSSKLNGKSNGECEEIPDNEPCDTDTCEEPEKRPEGKGQGELKPLRVLEALSASGLRALRYAREVEGIRQVVALDNDKASVEACRRNIKFNGSVAKAKVESNLADARVYMLTHPKEFDMVDLDPYGSPSVFLDSAVQSIADGGMLMCTATDMAVLCGGNGEVCYSKYGSYPLKAKYCHEMALRILLACIESHANRYKRYIVPVLSVQMDFYVRVFVRIYTSAGAMKNTPLKLSYVYQCTGCDSFHLQPLGRTVSKNTSVRYLPGFGPVVPQECSDCGKKYNMGGPIWSAPIHDQDWVTSILSDVKSMKACYPAFDRISAVLTTISEELPDVPLFVSLHNLCATLKCTSPSAVVFRSAVINAGYRISGTHVNPLGLKSDAPMDVIWDIMRCWVKKYPVKAQLPDHSGSVILAKEPVLQANFARAVASLSKAQAKKVARFLPNPERHWGPKLRAGRTITSKHASLLGPETVDNILNNSEEQGEEPEAKRKKTQESTSIS